MQSTEGPGYVIIRRERRSLLRRAAAHVLVQSREVPYFPGDADSFEIASGEVTLMLYPDKKLTFELKPGQTIQFTVAESVFTLGFILWHGLGMLGVLLLWSMSLAFGDNRDNFFLLAIIATYTQVRTARRQWYYMEETPIGHQEA